MINKNYAFLYFFDKFKDTLMIVFDFDKQFNKVLKRDNVFLLYFNDELIGINIINIQNVMKIFANGVILNPPLIIVSAVNNILINNGIEPLNSTFKNDLVFAKVKDKNTIVYKGNEINVDIDLTNYISKVVVFANSNCLAYSLKRVNKYHVLCNDELLNNNNHDIYYVDDLSYADKSFYEMEEK